MTSQIEKTPNNLWKEKDAIIQTPNLRSVKRIKSPTKKSQECKKTANELKIEDVFLNSEYFKHQSGNFSSLSFCSGDNGENQWTIDSKFEIPLQQKTLKRTPHASKVPAIVSAVGEILASAGKVTVCDRFPSETIKSDTAVLEKAKSAKSSPTKLKSQTCTSRQHTQENANKLLEGILSEKGRLDRDLITLVTEQMFQAERELQITRTHLIETIGKLNERDLEILQLHEKIQNLQAAKKSDSIKKQVETSTKTSEDYQRLIMASEKLKKQVKDMEDFLNDYGLVWVGDKLANQKPNFDKIVKSFQRLNAVASEPKIIQTTMGAKFEVPHELPVVLYSNGLLLRNRVFREYEEPSVASFLKDVEDGYFPSELQSEFPEGVPFEVVDKRNEVYGANSKTPVFQGPGNRLGSTNEGKPPPIVYLEPLKKLKNLDSRSSFSQDSNDSNSLLKKNYKKRSRSVFFQEDRNEPQHLDTCSLKSVTEFSEKQAPINGQQRQLNVKIRFGGERTDSFLLNFPEHEKMHSFQRALQGKLCERYHDECLIDENTNNRKTDFEIHIYGRNPIRLSECLNLYPAECEIVNNCVINVLEI